MRAKAEVMPQPVSRASRSSRLQPPAGSFANPWLHLWSAALLIGLCLWAYWPIFNGKFLMDDDLLVTSNPLVKSPDGLGRIWFSTEAADYWPITGTAFWLEWHLWGMNAKGYHITNVVLHILAALMVWALLRKLNVPGAYFAALLFAVHPVNVESVAWIAQLKNALAMDFFLLSLLFYERNESQYAIRNGAENDFRPLDSDPQNISFAGSSVHSIAGWYWFSLLAFVLAMLSKGSVAIGPLLILGLAWWRKGRIAAADVLKTAPFFVIAVALTAVNLWFQTHGSGEVIRSVGFAERVAGAGGVVWFYLSKALLPIDLLFVYPPWHIEAGDLRWWIPLIAAAAVAALLWRNRNHAIGRSFLIAWSALGFALLPVLGIVDVGYMKFSLVADHYAHIALIPVVAIVAAAWTFWRLKASTWNRKVAWAAAAGAIIAFAFAARQETNLYADAISLYQKSLEHYPDCWMLNGNLASQLLQVGRTDEALDYCKNALALNPNYVEAHNNFGILLARQGKLQQAFDEYHEALRLKPDYISAYNNLGIALEQAGQTDEAIEQYRRAASVKDAPAETFVNLGTALVNAGRDAEAIEPLERALAMHAYYPEVYINLGNALLHTGHPQEATADYRKAVELKPDSVEAHYNLGCVCIDSGHPREAAAEFREAIRLNPQLAESHGNYGRALAQLNQLDLAIAEFQQALQINPNMYDIWSCLADVYAAKNQFPLAIAAAEKGFALASGKTNRHRPPKSNPNLINFARGKLARTSSIL